MIAFRYREILGRLCTNPTSSCVYFIIIRIDRNFLFGSFLGLYEAVNLHGLRARSRGTVYRIRCLLAASPPVSAPGSIIPRLSIPSLSLSRHVIPGMCCDSISERWWSKKVEADLLHHHVRTTGFVTVTNSYGAAIVYINVIVCNRSF